MAGGGAKVKNGGKSLMQKSQDKRLKYVPGPAYDAGGGE
jgi:hypothetical protein